ncbi:MAG TPA: branched-chain amino acid ABC transporter permease, partial [Anaerolineales bacterium]
MTNIFLFLAGVITLIGIYSILTLAVNMHFGYAGLNSFGIVGFMAVGAYTYTILTIGPPHGDNFYQIGFSFPWWVGLIGAAVVTTLFAYIIALPTLRVGGDYLLIVTFASSEIIQKLLANESWLTNGTRGFMHILQPFRSSISGHYYQFLLAGLVVAILVV